MVITLGDLFKELGNKVEGSKVLAAMKLMDKKYTVNKQISIKGVDYFIVEPRVKK